MYTKSEDNESWVNDLVNGIQESLQVQITKNHADAGKKHMFILNEHLLIPGVIGEMEDHRNLRSYLLDRENTIKMQQDTIAKNADT
jgi:hypothetical protein